MNEDRARTDRLARNRVELGTFLRTRREALTPLEVGLPAGGRRRTPGLRREEVAALAGVGLTWYTWLEQGRDIGVSAMFLDNLARVLRLDAAERRHLFLLAHQRPPSEPGRTFCTVPPIVLRVMNDLEPHAAYVINLRWDVLAHNATVGALFGFDAHPPERRNLLWLLFADPLLRARFVHWETDAAAMLESFRRDFAAAPGDADARRLVEELEAVSPEFKALWRRTDVRAGCTGRRLLRIDEEDVAFDYTSFVADSGRHLRLITYLRRVSP